MTERLILLLIVLIVCSVTDVASGVVYDWVTLPGLAAMLFIAILQRDVAQAALGAGVSGGILLALHVLTGGRGMGLGDVKLAAVIGACVGSHEALIALGAAFVSGAMVGIVLLLLRRARRNSEMRFAPFLAFGAGVSVILPIVLR